MRTFGSGRRFVAAGYALVCGASVYGQGQVNGSGATLFVDFFRQPAAYNDFLDIDGDGETIDASGSIRDRLANPGPSTWGNLGPDRNTQTWWIFQYRSVGSVRGFQEWVDFQTCGFLPEDVPSERGIINTLDFAVLGVPQSISGTSPCTDDTDGDGIPNASGSPVCPTSIDFANADVESSWAIQGAPGAAAWFRRPTQSGYGQNPQLSRGTPAQSGFSAKLATLGGDCDGDPQTPPEELNFNRTSPDARTVYDTPIAFSPVAPLANRGAGIDTLRYTEMQHLWVTGRNVNGENLAVVSRDVGSGTRNAFANAIGVDPSWLGGDNVGVRVDTANFTNLGSIHQVANGGGSGIVENAVQNRRNSVGYTGLFGASRAIDDAYAGRYEIVNVIKDIDPDGPGPKKAATGVVRPSRQTLLFNADPNTGFQIAGIQTLATVGNPDANRHPSDPLYDASAPAMSNQNAADFINNIVSSLVEYEDPNDPSADLLLTPGQLLAQQFVLTSAASHLPLSDQPQDFEPNPTFNAVLQNFIANSPFNDTPAFGSINAAGLVPIRNANPSGYSDGSVSGAYFYNDGVLRSISGGARLSSRNALAADFNEDGVRDCDDAAAFMAALNDPDAVRGNFVATGFLGDMTVNVIIPEVVGDLNGDGNFDLEDARYFADGHAIVGGVLDRACGYTAIDNAWNALGNGNNPFGTVLATGVAYKSGDSRADISGGSADPQPGASPVHHDGVVDAKDIDYVFAQFGDWSDLDQAAFMDLSADMNGDLLVNIEDVRVIVEDILETNFGDADLDGTVGLSDLLTVLSNFGQTGLGWSGGDFNGSGAVDLSDLLVILANFGI